MSKRAAEDHEEDKKSKKSVSVALCRHIFDEMTDLNVTGQSSRTRKKVVAKKRGAVRKFPRMKSMRVRYPIPNLNL
jgi:hypothetical protein